MKNANRTQKAKSASSDDQRIHSHSIARFHRLEQHSELLFSKRGPAMTILETDNAFGLKLEFRDNQYHVQ
jgi:hypothetical protein